MASAVVISVASFIGVPSTSVAQDANETVEQLKDERDRLKTEIRVLKTQLAALRKQLSPDPVTDPFQLEEPEESRDNVVDVIETPRVDPRSSEARPSSFSASVLSRDTLDLLNQNIELEGRLRLAESELQRLRGLANAQAVSDIEVERATVEYETIRRRHELVDQLIAAEQESARAELEAIQRDYTLTRSETRKLYLKAQLIRVKRRLAVLGGH